MLRLHVSITSRPTVNLTIAADSTDYNLFVAAGSPSGACDVVCTVNTGINVKASSTAAAAFQTGGAWAATSTLKLVNNGTIAGAGGDGGTGASSSTSTQTAGGAGNPGGDAISCTYPLTIDNTNGFIYGGGSGGGGGGNAAITSPPGLNAQCGGGGGGAGRGSNATFGGGAGSIAPSAPGNPGTAGANGSSSGAGAHGAGGTYNLTYGGDGGDGGDWGAHGVSGSAAGGAPYTSSPGFYGLAGNAVVSNGNSITWNGGHDGTHVKGAET